jgi:hypothetical protein
MWPWTLSKAYSLGVEQLLFFVVLIAGSICLGCALGMLIVGRDNALRNLRLSTPGLIFSFLLGMTIYIVILLFRSYPWVNFYSLSSGVCIASLIVGFCRKQEVGALLADMGKPKASSNKSMLRIGLIGIAFALLQTWAFFTNLSHGIPENTSLELEVSEQIFWFSLVIYSITLGLDKPKFGENGIYFIFSFAKWQKINSYTWDPLRPNVLMILFKTGFPLWPGFMNIPIPAQHRDMVDSILDERLPGKNL